VDLGGDPATGEEEWTFTSALPEGSTNRVRVLSSQLIIDFEVRRRVGQQQIQVLALFSSGTNQTVTELHFQVAVEPVGFVFLVSLLPGLPSFLR
jgi:hypothetical protein